MWVLLPKLAHAGDAFEAVRRAEPGFLLAMLPLTLLLYVGSTFELLGACSVQLSFFATYRCQMAAAFMNRVTPSNVGGMAVNARYLQVSGVDAAAATATVGLTSATEAIVNVVLVVVFFAWAGRGADVPLALPSSTAFRVVVAVILIALVVFVVTPPGRKMYRDKVRPFLRGVHTSLVEVARSPLRLLSMFGGGFGRALTDFAALVVALAAFGPFPARRPRRGVYRSVRAGQRIADAGRPGCRGGGPHRRPHGHRCRRRPGDTGGARLPADHLLARDAPGLDLPQGDGEARRGVTMGPERSASGFGRSSNRQLMGVDMVTTGGGARGSAGGPTR